jgi:hypothetical protein
MYFLCFIFVRLVLENPRDSNVGPQNYVYRNTETILFQIPRTLYLVAARTDAIDSRRSHYDANTYQDWFLILPFLSFTTIQFCYQTRQNSPCPAASKIIFTDISHAIPFYFYFDVCLVGEFQTGQFCSWSSWSQVTLEMLSSVSFCSSYRLKSQSLYFVLLDCGTQSSGRVCSARIGLALLKFLNEYFTL